MSWAIVAMAGTAALGLWLLDADSVGSLWPMAAAVVTLAVGGSVTPSGDLSAFGLDGARAHTAIDISPLGVGLVGALVLSFILLRSLRGSTTVRELALRVGAVVVFFLVALGGLAWVGHEVTTIDGGALGLDRLPGGGGKDLTDKLPGGLGGLLPDKLGDLAKAKAEVGFSVDTAATLAGGACWIVVVLAIALLASRRTPLPRPLEAAGRVARPAVSSLVTVGLLTVVAGLAAAAYAMVGDDHPRRIAGAALLGAPNGTWLGLPLGLLVPWHGHVSGVLTRVLPDPVGELIGGGSDKKVTLSRLAELDGRVWLLCVAAVLALLFAGVLTAVRTEVGGAGRPGPRFVADCAVRLGAATALALPLLVHLTGLSANASLSVLGFDAFGAGLELRGAFGYALLLGALWGAAAGAAGALLARATGAAGRGAGRPADAAADGAGAGGGGSGDAQGPYAPGSPYRPPNADTNPYLRLWPGTERDPGGRGQGGGQGRGGERDQDGGGQEGTRTMWGSGTPPRRPGSGPNGDRPGQGGRPPPPPPPPPPLPPRR